MVPVKENKKNYNVEIRSEPVQEILGTIPHWIIRWGITLFLIIILILLIGSWFFKYPDFIPAEIEVITQNPPVDVIAKASGKIDEFFIHDKQRVEEGQRLAIIENPANYEEVFLLKEYLGEIKYFIQNADSSILPSFSYEKYNNLGEIQSFYSLFLKSYLDYENFLNVDYHNKKIEALEVQTHDYRIYYEYLYKQRNTLEEDYNLMNKDYKRHKKLFENGAIAEVELERSKSEVLKKQHDFEGARTNLANTQIQINELEEDILDLQLQYRQEYSKLKLALRESNDNLISQINIWEQNYLIKAPITGSASFNKFWAENQNVVIGEKVISIVPYDSTNIIGKMLMPIRGSGKVKTGQKINIKFYNYPYMEFGMVTGIIKNISQIPANNTYAVEVTFPEGLTTNYGITLNFNQQMKGSAEIITDDIRFLVRIIRPIRSLIQNRSFKKLKPTDNGSVNR